MTQGNYAHVNGLDLYYEIHGAGKPLLLLPGGFATIEWSAELNRELACVRQVIAVELQAHGHTADIDRPLSFEYMADDIAALIEHLELEKADVFGYSLGGGVALQTAIRRPDLVDKLVLVSTPFRRQGWFPEVLAGMASISMESMSGTPIHEAYLRSAPKPEDWSRLVAKVHDLLGKEYDWSEQVAAIKSPVLIIAGDADSVRFAHVVEMFALFGGGIKDGFGAGRPDSRLAVIPGAHHIDILFHTALLAPMINEFLDAQSQVK